MKKFLYIASLIIAAVAFTGCGGGGSGGGGGGVVPPPVTNWDVLYIDDAGLNGIAGLPYDCSSNSGFTDGDGGFTFIAGDNCTFDFTGFDGTIFFTDPLFLDFEDGSGVTGVGYDCASGVTGATDFQGGFDFDVDDICTFYL